MHTISGFEHWMTNGSFSTNVIFFEAGAKLIFSSTALLFRNHPAYLRDYKPADGY
jgi:hypothetical protein